MRKATSLLAVSTLFLWIPCGFSLINFILIGSTGDLSRKYLWEALFIQFVENHFEDSMNIYAAATRNENEGFPIVKSYLDSLHCKSSWTKDFCEDGLRKFKSRISYMRLRSSDDYQTLDAKIAHPQESLRIFYLSVSPSLYENIASNINSYSRPSSELRVVFEKPFGMDYGSAVELSQQLSRNLQEKEIYRVDHYLGKVGMRSIIDFRRINMDLLSMLNFPTLTTRHNDKYCEVVPSVESIPQHVPLVEVVMKEKEHTGGRTVYYDQFGIIRDVMQNHLTQALVYSLMNLKSEDNSETFGKLEHRLDLLQQLKYHPSSLQDEQCHTGDQETEDEKGIWLGQYTDYINHLEEDLIEYARKTSTAAPTDVSSRTPTAASIFFNIDLRESTCSIQRKDTSMRVMISAGKALESREMYVRVRSQSRPGCNITYGIQGGLDKFIGENADTGPYIFLEGKCWIHDGSIFQIPEDWNVLLTACHPHFLKGLELSDVSQAHIGSNVFLDEDRCILRPKYIFEVSDSNDRESSGVVKSDKYRNNAYIEILGALLRNDRSYFTTTEELLSQWKIWDSVLKDAECTDINPYHIGWGGLDN